MNVTLTSLEALILKATNETLRRPDAAAVEAFCAVMRDSAEGPQLAAQALAARIHSLNTREAMLALAMVHGCMRRGNAAFQAEVGKFRFLNELIKLVSPKYLADRTAPDVRNLILQLLYAWSIHYSKETKFKVAYEMLKHQGVVKETPPPFPPADDTPFTKTRTKNAIFEDDEKAKLLQKLLQSKKPEDIQHANRLIKTMVREEERRSEANSRRAQEVATALDSADLLNDMLDNSANASYDEVELIQELNLICAKMRPVLQQLAANDTDTDNLNDILRAIDLLDEVQYKYEVFDECRCSCAKATKVARCCTQRTQTSDNESLLEFDAANSDFARQGRGDGVEDNAVGRNTMDELGDIFSTEGGASIAEPLKPVSLMPGEDVDVSGSKSKVEGWNELDSLGEQLLKQSLPDNAKRVDLFNSKTKKIPMNALTSPKHEPAAMINSALLDLDFFIKNPAKISDEVKVVEASTGPMVDDVMVDISTTAPNNNNIADNILNLGLPDVKPNKPKESVEVKELNGVTVQKVGESLADLEVSLESVTPSDIAPLTVFQEDHGVTVMLHYCKDRPRPDVHVMVISTTNKNRAPVDDYKFQGVVPKGCKLRLLPPSGSSLPAYNPFLPPPALTQVMLVSQPPSIPFLSIKFVVTYTCDNDAFSEIRELRNLSLNHV